MTTSLALIQYDLQKLCFQMRIGDKFIELPKSLTDQLGNAISEVEPFNHSHAYIAHSAWDGTLSTPDEAFIG